MNYKQFNNFCESLPGTSYIVQWGNSHVWKVGGKVFAIGGWEKNDGEPAITFKVSDNHFLLLQGQPGFRPAPYMASRGMKWIQQYESALDSKELKYYITESHRIVSLGLTKKLQNELGLNQK
ncbi:MAG: MmcQ/YjbR family DNA-binding protein [Cellvibrionaceae bacterium]